MDILNIIRLSLPTGVVLGSAWIIVNGYGLSGFLFLIFGFFFWYIVSSTEHSHDLEKKRLELDKKRLELRLIR